jgi:hypothetical protein
MRNYSEINGRTSRTVRPRLRARSAGGGGPRRRGPRCRPRSPLPVAPDDADKLLNVVPPDAELRPPVLGKHGYAEGVAAVRAVVKLMLDERAEDHFRDPGRVLGRERDEEVRHGAEPLPKLVEGAPLLPLAALRERHLSRARDGVHVAAVLDCCPQHADVSRVQVDVLRVVEGGRVVEEGRAEPRLHLRRWHEAAVQVVKQLDGWLRPVHR